MKIKSKIKQMNFTIYPIGGISTNKRNISSDFKVQ